MLKPLISEKSIARTKENKYTFLLDSPMPKLAIANIIKTAFSVDVLSVATMKRIGKEKRTGRFIGTRKSSMIAIVTLKEKQTIPGYTLDEPTTETKKDTETKPAKKKEVKAAKGSK